MVVYPIQYLISVPTKLVDAVDESITGHTALQDENQRLKSELLVNNTRLLKFLALEKENIRLRALVDSSFKLGEQVLVAEILSVNLDPYKHTVLVDKGSRFGAFQGQSVLDANGIVGQVLRANPLNSEIILISDPSHAIPVQVNRNGLRTIAVGSGKINQLNLPFLPNNADIREGDLVITSGLGGAFPQGYPVAIITKVSPQPDKPFSRIEAKPQAHLDRSRELMLVWSSVEPIPLYPTPTTKQSKTPINNTHSKKPKSNEP